MRGSEYDHELERKLGRAVNEMKAAKTPAARRKAFQKLQALHKKRSPQRVRQMEEQMGLR